MTIPSVEIEMRPDQIVGLLERFGERAKDFTPVLRGRFRATVSDFFQRQFATEGAAGGERWASLALFTTVLRQRPGHNLGGILWDTGRLRASWVKAPAPEGIEVVTATSYRRGTTVPYAVFHQTGYTMTSIFGRPRKTPLRVPPRKQVPDQLPPAEQQTWERVLADWLTEGKA